MNARITSMDNGEKSEHSVHYGKSSSSHFVAIALGSNLGNPLVNLESACHHLSQLPGVRLVRRSPWYETEPIGPPQPSYLNGCVILEVHYTPLQLLHRLLQVEHQLGRIRQERWGPRTLDLDILLFEDLILDLPQLQIPHPRMGDRAFVLIPLVGIAPHWIHPLTQQSIAEMAKQVNPKGVVRFVLKCP